MASVSFGVQEEDVTDTYILIWNSGRSTF